MAAILLAILIYLWPRIESSRTTAWISLVVVLAFAGIHHWVFNTVVEDAYISFRYSHNLTHGLGLVFNPGERVEGYSNFLWVMILAGLELITGNIPMTAKVLGLIFSGATLLMVYFLVQRISDGRRSPALLAVLLTASVGSFAAYGPSGLETPLYELLLVGIVYAAWSSRWGAVGALAGLATLVRPDGVVVLLLVLAWMLVRKEERGLQLRRALTVIIAYAVIIVPWTIWRLDYYGHLIPNAIAAKRGMLLWKQIYVGSRYVGQFILGNLPLALLLLIVLVALYRNRRSDRLQKMLPVESLLLILVGGLFFFVAFVGGDWMPAWRFISPIVPLGAMLIVILWDRNIGSVSIWQAERRQIAVFAAASIFLLYSSLTHPFQAPRVQLWTHQIDGLKEIGQWLNRSLPRETVVAVYANGALSYYSELPTIDMLGLTDEHIARHGKRNARGGGVGHIAHDYEYVAARRPDIAAFLDAGFENQPDRKIGPQFVRDYIPATFRFVHGTNPRGQYVTLALLKSSAPDLVARLTVPDSVEFLGTLDDSIARHTSR
jgi:hypothetical protein